MLPKLPSTTPFPSCRILTTELLKPLDTSKGLPFKIEGLPLGFFGEDSTGDTACCTCSDRSAVANANIKNVRKTD
jgi:hypothetical protein